MPVPGLPDVTVSQPALLAADHPQCAAAVTAKLPLALSSVTEAWLGAMSIVQASRPSSRTDTDCPAIVKEPVRRASAGFAVTLTFTTPFPVPLEPLVMDIQALSETAVHVQWLAVVTFTDPAPPDGPNESDDVDRA